MTYSDINTWLVPAVVAVVSFLVGWFLSRLRLRYSEALQYSEAETDPQDEEEDEPTAPIAPMVEMARSPHDRQRDIAVGKSVVRQIDFLDSMIKKASSAGDAEIEKQLRLLRDEFFTLLGDCSVEAYSLDPDTVLTTAMRSRIQIVGGEAEKGQPAKVSETVLCGFRYAHNDDETLLLRKAEVVIK